MEKLERLVITHCDLDAGGSVIVLDYFDAPYDELIYMNYDQYEEESSNPFDYEELKKYKEVWYTDFSPDTISLDILKKEGVKVKIWDHHQSFYDTFCEYDKEGLDYEYYFDLKKSGTEIVYDYLREGKRIPKRVDSFVKLVTTYDLWQEHSDKFETASDLNRLMYKLLDYKSKGAYKYFPFVERMVNRLLQPGKDFYFTKSEQSIIFQERKKENSVTNNALKDMLVRTDEKGYKFGVVKAKSKVSMVAHKILKLKEGKLDYLAIINEYKKEEPKISLRSKGFDLLKLNYTAGHVQACGVKDIDKKFVNDFWEGRVYELGYKKEE